VTLAKALKDAGYKTCHVGKWHLGTEAEGWPDRFGFDQNVGGTHRGQPPSYFSPYGIESLPNGPKGEYLTDREAFEACRFIKTHRDKPFFLYLAHYGVHTPLQAKKDMVESFEKKIKPGMRHKNATYAAMVASVDQSLGRIRKELEDCGLTERTVIVFTSDNGGLLRSTDNTPLRVGKGSAYEGGVRVPYIAYWPGVTPAGTVCVEPVITPDLYPTVLQITGAKGDVKHNATVDGVSLVPLLKDPKSRLKRDALFWHYPHYHPGGATPYGAIRAGDWKLIEFFEDQHVELYNLKDDLGEKKDLAKKEPDRAAALRKRLLAWRVEVGAQMPSANPDYKPGK
jgi:arylsulfatase A-like enzyme